MATVVAGVGVPHTPVFPLTVALDDPGSTGRFFAQVRAQLDEARPDVIVMFDSDHLNTFFLDNLPVFSIGVAARTSGPNDATPGLAPVELAVPESMAAHVRNGCLQADFDVALSREFTVDHSILVPLHYLRPAADLPLLPVFINGLVAPLPAAARCRLLGAAVRAAIDAWPEDLRVALVASGSFSLDVGGSGINPGSIFGVPDPRWADRVASWIGAGDVDAVVESATPGQLSRAGNVGGELLNWLALLGAIGPAPPDSLEIQPEFGHGYAFWQTAP